MGENLAITFLIHSDQSSYLKTWFFFLKQKSGHWISLVKTVQFFLEVDLSKVFLSSRFAEGNTFSRDTRSTLV